MDPELIEIKAQLRELDLKVKALAQIMEEEGITTPREIEQKIAELMKP
ncbi:MAG: hypothetical protein V1735_04000 [Nanoarchaeota archaeon]